MKKLGLAFGVALALLVVGCGGSSSQSCDWHCAVEKLENHEEISSQENGRFEKEVDEAVQNKEIDGFELRKISELQTGVNGQTGTEVNGQTGVEEARGAIAKGEELSERQTECQNEVPKSTECEEVEYEVAEMNRQYNENFEEEAYSRTYEETKAEAEANGEYARAKGIERLELEHEVENKSDFERAEENR
jgi:hypothetical protein